ncbi:MAG: HepT-like ribonuclease domain-containing protein [Nanoarchaeota archaeon]
MYDIQRIGKIIADIEKHIKELDNYNLALNDLYESKNYHASSMLIFAILNKLIDLGSEMISAEKLGAPNTYQDIMILLAKGNIINKNQAGELNNLVKKRNIFAHFYEDISEKELYKTIKEIKIVEGFLITIKKIIGKE